GGGVGGGGGGGQGVGGGGTHVAGGWIVEHRHLGRAQALDLVAQPCGFLEIEIGGGLTHARLEIGDHRLEIVPNGRGFRELSGARRARRDQHVVALVHAVEDVGDALAHALRRDAVRRVVFGLFFAAAVGLLDRALHRAGHAVRIENYLAVDVARGTADGLDQ